MMEIPKRFMVVDDDSTNNLLCGYAIKRLFSEAKITLFTNPETALGAIEEDYGKSTDAMPTILLLDINMPTMTGWDFLDIFRDFDEKVRNQFVIYILSSSVDERDMKKAEANIFVSGFLSKPLSLEGIQSMFK